MLSAIPVLLPRAARVIPSSYDLLNINISSCVCVFSSVRGELEETCGSAKCIYVRGVSGAADVSFSALVLHPARRGGGVRRVQPQTAKKQ